jgi:hypothetical protein
VNPRNRLVNFRVTDEELRRLKAAAALRNSRCLSDFARFAIIECACASGHAVAPIDSAAGQWASFDRRLAQLESAMARLVTSLETFDILAVNSQK